MTMQPISKETVTGFNKEPYIIRVYDHGTHQEVSVSWFNEEGKEQTIDVLKDDIKEHVEPLLASIRKAIRNKR